MFEQVSGLPNQSELEEGVLAWWQERRVFDKLRIRNRGNAPFSFLDGPITANNPMGVHHAWGRTLKDLYQRYWAMRGRDQRYQNGFDCQGLWVEVEVERELGFRSKHDIERYGIAQFASRCRERVERFSDIITQESMRLGCWMDWDNSYRTDSDQNNYAIWSFLKTTHQRKLIFRGTDVMPWCPRCGTGLSQQEVQEAYKEVTHSGVVVRMPLLGREREYLLIWTTTPWTLTANVAVAVNPELTYVRVRQGDDVYYLSANRATAVMTTGPLWQVEAQVSGNDLVDLRYAGPFDDLPQQRDTAAAHRVVAWEEVTEDEGTGLVHVAPGCGKEDYDLARREGLPAVAPVDENGVFLPGAGPFAEQLALEIADKIIADLRYRGVLYRVDPYAHRYPHCWRCGSEVLFRLVEEWFISMDPWREQIMRVADDTKWVPAYGREVELDWLRNMRDWMISKKRYWGLALPIWTCSCGWFDVIGSKEELQSRAVEGWDQFEGHSPHRPWVDAVRIRCERCGELATRIQDVGNPWLDAGVVPYSTLGYFQDRSSWDRWFPADLVIESLPGQFRNWFYSLLAMSTMLEGRKPVLTIMGHSSVVDEKGEEMHKSRGNAIWFREAADKMGADLVRWVVASHPLTQPLRFGWAAGDEVRNWLRTLWNVYNFLAIYASLDGWPKTEESMMADSHLALDRWLRARTTLTGQVVSCSVESFDPARGSAALMEFLDDLSNWWVRRSRRRFWGKELSVEKTVAFSVLHTALVNFCQMLAPFMPFTAESLYQRLVAPFPNCFPESVHLCFFPEAQVSEEDDALIRECARARAAVSAGRAARATANLRVRQPLAAARVLAEDNTPPFPAFVQDVMDELNVKRLDTVRTPDELGEVRGEESGLLIGLDTELTDELVQEGAVRDLIRHVQNLRKRVGLRIEQRVRLWLVATDSPVAAAVRQLGDVIAAETLAVEVNMSEPPEGTTRTEAKVAGHKVVIGMTPL